MTTLDVSKITLAQKQEILRVAAETRRFEIERFWARSVFFWGFVAAAFIAYAQLYGKEDTSGLAFIVACFGLVCSVAWTLLNRGGKYWQEAWESKLESVEMDVLGAPLFSNSEPLRRSGVWGPASYSVSRLTIALSDFTAFIWLTLALTSAPTDLLRPQHRCLSVVAAVTAAYIVSLFLGARSRRSGR